MATMAIEENPDISAGTASEVKSSKPDDSAPSQGESCDKVGEETPLNFTSQRETHGSPDIKDPSKLYTVHVAIQTTDEADETSRTRTPILPARYRELYKHPDEISDDDDEYIPPPPKPKSTGRGRGRPRKVPMYVNLDSDDKATDVLATDTMTTNVTLAVEPSDTGGKTNTPVRRGPKLKYETFSENELLSGRPFRCDVQECGQTFTTANWLSRHKEVKHSGIDLTPSKTDSIVKREETISKKSFMCPKCGRTFSQEGNMKAHTRIHTGEKKFICDICQKSFGLAESLKRHKMSHLGIKPYDCDVCSAKFASNIALKEHKHIHGDIKPYQCATCKNQFRQISVYQRHLLTHNGELKFPCALCDRRFTQKIYLRSHMKKHTGERPFKCDLCEKWFAHASDKKRHQKTHSGTKPYGCSMCSARFTDPSSCRRHMKEHNSTLPFTCHSCGEKFKRKISLRAHINRHCNAPLHQVIISGSEVDINMIGDNKLLLVGPNQEEIPVLTRMVYDENQQTVLEYIETRSKSDVQELVSSDVVLSEEKYVPDEQLSATTQQITQQIIQQIERQLGTHEGVTQDGQQVQVAYHILHDDENQQIVEIQYEPLEQADVMITHSDNPIKHEATTTGKSENYEHQYAQPEVSEDGSTSHQTNQFHGDNTEQSRKVIAQEILTADQEPRTCQNEAFNAQNEALNSQNEAFSGQNEAFSGQNEALNSQNETFSSQNGALSGQYEALGGQNEAFSGQNEALNSQNGSFSGQNEAFRTQNEALKVDEVRTVENGSVTVNNGPTPGDVYPAVKEFAMGESVLLVETNELVTDRLDLSQAEIVPVDQSELENIPISVESLVPLVTAGQQISNPAHSLANIAEATESDQDVESDSVVLDIHPIPDVLNSDITHCYIDRPDFSSQEYYNWLSAFTDQCKQAIVPVSEQIFKNISQLQKTLSDVMASPSGILANKDNFKILMTISSDLNAIISKHLMCVLQQLE